MKFLFGLALVICLFLLHLSANASMLNLRHPVIVAQEDSNVKDKTSCHIPAKGAHHICKHCGCRMKVNEGDHEKACDICKCGKKLGECIGKKK